MVRDTSIEVYHQVEAEGLLSKRRFQVYECLFKHGPMTQNETFIKINLTANNVGRKELAQDSIKPRFAELKELGVIRETGKRPCKITNRKVYEWDVTSKLPNKDLIIRKSTKEKKEEILNDIAELGKELPDDYKQDLRYIYRKIEKF